MLKPNCLKISFPNSYYKGYNPETTYLKHNGWVQPYKFNYTSIIQIKYFLFLNFLKFKLFIINNKINTIIV
jgi:hypothetical protein